MNPNHHPYGLGGGPNLNLLDNMLMAAGFQVYHYDYFSRMLFLNYFPKELPTVSGDGSADCAETNPGTPVHICTGITMGSYVTD